MAWPGIGRRSRGKTEVEPGEFLPRPRPKRLGWPAAALVIGGISILLWLGVGVLVSRVMGWR